MDSDTKEATDMEEALKEFDFVHFTLCDLHGIPKGKLVPREMVSQACRDGIGIYAGTHYLGVQSETSQRLTDFTITDHNGTMRPLPGTVRPLEWSSAPKRRIGQVMCQLELGEGEVFAECPRLAAQRQVERLHNKGYRFKSAFECEFYVLKADSLKPVMDEPLHRRCVVYNLDLLATHQDLYTDMLTTLRHSGVHIEYFHLEAGAGQMEVCMQPQWGVGSADDAFALRCGVRTYFHQRDLRATFMALPFDYNHSSSELQFNHSLWTLDGRNVFLDAQDPLKLSATARHWIAGLVEHAPALNALSSPTLNCYRRVGLNHVPDLICWGIDHRGTAIRVRNTGGNVFMENRLPSAACNPYLALAATIAAGLDGVDRKLTCPDPGRIASARQLPGSLAEALDALEKDKVLTEALGGKLVEYYLTVKRDIEIKHFQTGRALSAEELMAKEREYYMYVM